MGTRREAVRMFCHKCCHDADVRAGKYAGVAYEETPCAKCSMKMCSVGSREFEDWRRDETVKLEDIPDEARDGGGRATEMPVEVLVELVAGLLALPTAFRDVVCWRLCGWSYRDIAAAQGITPAGAEWRHKRALEMSPLLASAFAAKAARRERRKG